MFASSRIIWKCALFTVAADQKKKKKAFAGILLYNSKTWHALYFTLTTQDTTTLLQWNHCFDYRHCRGDFQFIMERRQLRHQTWHQTVCTTKYYLCAKLDHNRGSSLGKSSCVHLANLIYTALGTYNLYAKAHFRVHLMDRSWKFPGLGQGRLVVGSCFELWCSGHCQIFLRLTKVLKCWETAALPVRELYICFFFFSCPAATHGGCGRHVCFSQWWNYLLIVLFLVTFMIRFFFPSLRWCIWM